MTLFIASISIICAAILGLGGGSILGFRFSQRFTGAMDRVLQRPEYRNTVGTVWALAEVQKLIADGCTVEQIRDWIDKTGDDIQERFSTGETGEKIIEGWKAVKEEEENDRGYDARDH